MDSSFIIQGLAAGCIYALTGMTLNVVYRPTNVFNFAQGALVMIGAMLCASMLAGGKVSWVVAVIAAVVAVGGIALIEWLIAISPIIRRPSGHGAGWVISTLAATLILEDAVGKLVGPDPRIVPPPPGTSLNSHFIAGLEFNTYQITIIVVTAVMVAALGWFYSQRTGKAIIAIAEDRDAALLRGIEPARLGLLSCVVGGGLAALTGILAAPMMYASVALGPTLLIKGFESVAIGGIGSMRGVVIGGCILGVFEALSGSLMSPGYQSAATFALVLAILLLRPQGLFGTTTARVI
jgi:branched-chain amino acid transport system permease protein